MRQSMEIVMTPEQEVDAWLALGKLVGEGGNVERAERIYMKALAVAETKTGKYSGVTGCALLELWDLYEETNRQQEAHEIWARLTQILIENYPLITGNEIDR